MRIVFMGTPEFAANILYELNEQHDVVAVYTRRDAVRGRGKDLVPSPVKLVAEKLGIPVRVPATLRDPEAIEELAALAPDAICVAAYGMILPQEVLDIPPYGCLNVHASLLPKYRGAAPIERAILNGDSETGVCIMKMEAGLDTGPCCISRSLEIGDLPFDKVVGELADLGACSLLSALYALENGGVHWIEQDDSSATYAEKVEKKEFMLDADSDAHQNSRRIQSSCCAHPARCVIAGKSVTILSGRCTYPEDQHADPGAVTFMGKRLLLWCSEGAIEVGIVKPDGKKEMPAAAFAAGIQGIKDGNLTWECM